MTSIVVTRVRSCLEDMVGEWDWDYTRIYNKLCDGVVSLIYPTGRASLVYVTISGKLL